VREILQDLYERDEIYRADYDGWYCVACERFYTEKDLVDNLCPEPGCGRTVERIAESNWFFRMSRHQAWLVEYIEAHPTFIQPEFRRNETLGFLKKPLGDLCVSRPKKRLDWGVELPFDPDFVTYVWFDALVNYISAVGYRSDEQKFRTWWPASCHLIGKDILTTHTVYWPIMLKAMGLPMPETVFAHGWWLVGRDKMSKTTGNVVDPMAFADRYGVDAFRYFLMAEMTLGQDASFTEENFIRRYNTDLANDLGNMLNRVTKLIHAHCGGCVPEAGAATEDDEHLRRVTLDAAQAMVDSVAGMRPDQGLAGLAAAVREANRYLEKTQPWTLAKQGESARLGSVLYCAAEALRIVSGMLYPVMPDKMAALRRILSLEENEPDFATLRHWGRLEPGAPIGAVQGLFPRIAEKACGADAKVGAKIKPNRQERKKETPMSETTDEGLIGIDDFRKTELKTARILEAERVEGTDKLMRLTIDLGAEQRPLVAGIAQHYSAESLIGKTIVVVANLKPAKIRGLESRGMLLAAGDGTNLRLLIPDGDLPPGSRIS
jgi:methionyl-tRNA synthetase